VQKDRGTVVDIAADRRPAVPHLETPITVPERLAEERCPLSTELKLDGADRQQDMQSQPSGGRPVSFGSVAGSGKDFQRGEGSWFPFLCGVAIWRSKLAKPTSLA
jgi:hypothetical protein